MSKVIISLLDFVKKATQANREFCSKIIEGQIEIPENLEDVGDDTKVTYPRTIAFQGKIWPIDYDPEENVVTVREEE